jgi:hypothetical protein
VHREDADSDYLFVNLLLRPGFPSRILNPGSFDYSKALGYAKANFVIDTIRYVISYDQVGVNHFMSADAVVQPAAAFSYRTFYRTSGVSLWCIIAVGEQPSMLVAPPCDEGL